MELVDLYMYIYTVAEKGHSIAICASLKMEFRNRVLPQWNSAMEVRHDDYHYHQVNCLHKSSIISHIYNIMSVINQSK